MIKFLASCRALSAGLLLTLGVSAQAASISSFGVAVLPDTQFYSRYNGQLLSRYGNEPYTTQTHWLVDHSAELGIPFVIHLGDVVDQVNQNGEWIVADNAMKVLENAHIPYSILAGNHDVTNGEQTDLQRNLANEPYLTWFPTSRAAAQSTFQGRDATGFHEYHIFTFQGQQYMSLALGWNASANALQWANDVIRAHPTVPVILSTHDSMYIAADGVTAMDSDYGNYLWDNLVKNTDQIFLVVNGHNHGSAYKTRANAFGHNVLQAVVDYQMAYMGGNGYMRIFEFDLTNNEIRALSFSPWVPTKPTNTLTSYDVAVLTEPNNEFIVSMNFAQRFAGFNPTFAAGTANRDEALTETVRSMILENYEDPETPAAQVPFDSEDYPHNSATVAHWRFDGGANGAAIPVGTVVPDVTGANPLSRAALTGAATTADAVWAADRHALSATKGSVHFAANKNTGTWFTTANNAALNANNFTSGYTIEAFIKMDKNWTVANNAWMNILTRGGKRSSIPGWYGSYGDSSPLQFGISNLREIQFEPTVFYDDYWRIAQANWSGEIMADRWTHIAAVNDATTKQTTLYIEGAPVLRNSSGYTAIAGLATEPWVVGGAVNGASGTGFFGYISEIRISNKPLTSDQWLTARKHRVRGAGGRQAIVGTEKDDQVFNNQGADTLTGGAGSNTFVYQTIRDGLDTITDFTAGKDKLNLQGLLSSIGYNGTGPLADGTVKVVDSTSGAVVQVKYSNAYRNMIVLRGVTAAQANQTVNFLF